MPLTSVHSTPAAPPHGGPDFVGLATAVVGVLRRSEVLGRALASLEETAPAAAWCLLAHATDDGWKALPGRGVGAEDVQALVRDACGADARVEGSLAAGRLLGRVAWRSAPSTGGRPTLIVACWDRQRRPRPRIAPQALERAASFIGAALHAAGVVELLLERTAHDPLTGLLNRRGILDELARELARASRRRAFTAVLFLDLDGFKQVNDRWGHAAGDRVLASLGHELPRLLRASDTVGRIGGDEFLVVLPDTDLRTAHAAGRRLARAVAALEIEIAGERLEVGLSCGAASTGEGLAGRHLVDQADRRMLARKRRRRPRGAGPALPSADRDRGN